MEINKLLRDHQLAQLNAQQADTLEGRVIYRELAGYYGERITEWRRSRGLIEDGWPRDERGPGPGKCE
ncbi:hypothetical protein [Altererythrobacter sp. GH1-8]|uniref:hypothetical protein n=1 Tax=Altererythrobacter sp. GH1-8 TaxID=3349333 RepID=UPI00374D512B